MNTDEALKALEKVDTSNFVLSREKAEMILRALACAWHENQIVDIPLARTIAKDIKSRFPDIPQYVYCGWMEIDYDKAD